MKYNFVGLLVFSGSFFFAQKETQNWYFPSFQGAILCPVGLNFGSNPPVLSTVSYTGVMNNSLSGTSISDSMGNLLFYTDGYRVATSSHTLMVNGFALSPAKFYNGNYYENEQYNLIVKKPGAATGYYIFSVDEGQLVGTNWPPPQWHDLKFSEIDMGLAAGQGSVVSKNNYLAFNTGERIAAVNHCNGTDVWVVTHELNSNNFKVYLVTASGVNPNPVISSPPLGPYTGTINSPGCLKISPNGRKIGMENVVLDFDDATGAVSNPINLSISSGFISSPRACEFSRDSKKYYVLEGPSGWQKEIYQWDLCPKSTPPGSLVGVSSGIVTGLQLAPNNKIYTVKLSNGYLGAIQNPDSLVPSCNYLDSAFSIAPRTGFFSLPTFVSSYFHTPESPIQSLSYSVANCNEISFDASEVLGCSASERYTENFLWCFGDPGSGVSNTSTLTNALHIYSNPGVYQAYLVLNYNCHSDTVYQTINVPGCNAIEKINIDNEAFAIYPNPCEKNTVIEVFKVINIVLYDAGGKTIFEEELLTGKHSVDWTQFQTGIYQVIAIAAHDKKVYAKRIIKLE